MPRYCSRCEMQLGFLSSTYPDLMDDGSIIKVCRNCWQTKEANVLAEFKPFQISEGYTRIKARVFLSTWLVPPMCNICSSPEEPLLKEMILVNNGAVSISIPIYKCQRCSFYHSLNALQYIEYKLEVSNLTIDIGNPSVAGKYLKFLESHLATVKHNLLNGTDPINVMFGDEEMSLPPSAFHDDAEKLGVKDLIRFGKHDVK